MSVQWKSLYQKALDSARQLAKWLLEHLMKFAKRIALRGSLTWTLMAWMVLIAALPLGLMAAYSILTFKKHAETQLNREYTIALQGISFEFENFLGALQNNGINHSTDAAYVSALSNRNIQKISEITSHFLHGTVLDFIQSFSAEGKLIVHVAKSSAPAKAPFIPLYETRGARVTRVKADILSRIRQKGYLTSVEPFPAVGLLLIRYNAVYTRRGQFVGILKESLFIDERYGQTLKTRSNLDLVITDKDLSILTTAVTEREAVASVTQAKRESFINGNLVPFGLEKKSVALKYLPLVIQEKTLGYVGVLGSLAGLQQLTSRLQYTTMAIVLLLLLVISSLIWIVGKLYLKPLQQLTQIADRLKGGETLKASEIPSSEVDEINTLLSSFSQMILNMQEMQKSLIEKIEAVEKANSQILKTQAQLVHTAKMAALGQLVAGIVHELNTPVGYISSNLYQLKVDLDKMLHLLKLYQNAESRLDTKTAEPLLQARKESDWEFLEKDLPELISNCIDGSERIQGLVSGLRNFSRIDEAEQKRVDLHEGIDNTLKLLAGEIKDRITIEKHYGKLPPVTCYPGQLNQVWMNLLTNAIQAIEGRGTVTISTEALENEVRVTLSDTGHGIPEEILPKIFDPFFTTKGMGKGTGLGLTISYGIVRQHGGNMLVSSEGGKGTTVTVTLPLR
ncbi:MAG: hypothetical protein HY391_05480 [Deltaproteobacteria bacterium]|nr:hypothetical protein [Deltaproteobacteria bacterium]